MSRKTKKPINKNLFRVDLNLQYLVYTDKENYTEHDVEKWIKNDLHSGEFDEQDGLTINKVTSSKQIQDFLDLDVDYNVYHTDEQDNGISVHSLVEQLGLDADVMIDKLKKMGYTVTKDKK